jgi:uncharacterized protein DUF3562
VSMTDARSADDVAAATAELAWEQLAARLRGRFAGEGGDPALVDAIVADECARFDGARIMTFVPLLVERRVAERLRAERAPAPVPVR